MKNASANTAFADRKDQITSACETGELPVGVGGFRDAEDDFFCLRFRVWYPSFDCAIRTRYRTCPSCRDCEQGRFNLKRHRSELARMRRPFRRA